MTFLGKDEKLECMEGKRSHGCNQFYDCNFSFVISFHAINEECVIRSKASQHASVWTFS